MTTETGRLSPMQGVRWLWKMGLLIPLTVGAALLLLVAITLASPLYDAPDVKNAGAASDYTFGEPKQFKDEDFWLSKQADGSFLALYELDPATGCTIGFDTAHELLGRRAWFRDACSGSAYDLTGSCFDGPCDIGLNRYKVTIENGDVIVDPRPDSGTHGVIRTQNGDPVNPPQ